MGAGSAVTVREVSEEGILLRGEDRAVDVLFDGRRIWSFWVLRDTEPAPADADPGWRYAAWARPLRRYLDGRAQVTVRDPVSGQVFFDGEVAFGTGRGEIRFVNRDGVEVGIDKSGRLVPTFASRSETDVAALLGSIQTVIEALTDCGIEPFVAYGTLLGAVREGRLLGHDSDADLGYVSRHHHPVDVARESFQVQRALVRRGLTTKRYSGGAFKIEVREGDIVRGLDVFGGFLDAGRLYLMGEVGTDFEESWIYPLGTATLEGRPVPVPAVPERLLEAMYGPGWKVPDPAFQFTTSEDTVRRLDSWFRGNRPNVKFWQRRYGATRRKPPPAKPSALARLVHRELRGEEVLDVGAGRGGDALWLARRGARVTAYDYAPAGLSAAADLAHDEGLDLSTRQLNLSEWRSVLGEGARLAHDPRPRVVLARHLLDATDRWGRESFARFCSMALRTGGRAYVEFHGRGRPDLEWVIGRVDTDQLVADLRRFGARRVDVGPGAGPDGDVLRLVGEW